jgi:hypothetical protein
MRAAEAEYARSVTDRATGTAVEVRLPGESCSIKGAASSDLTNDPFPRSAQMQELAAALDAYAVPRGSLPSSGFGNGNFFGLRRSDVDLHRRTITVAQQRQVDRCGRDLLRATEGRSRLSESCASVDA